VAYAKILCGFDTAIRITIVISILTLLLSFMMVLPLIKVLSSYDTNNVSFIFLRWSAEFGTSRNGSPELHVMLAEYIYSESPETVTCYNSLADKNVDAFYIEALVFFMSHCCCYSLVLL
jgi:hypothetical protein